MRAFFVARRAVLLTAALLLVVFVAASCGRVAPSYEPGQLEVTSEPTDAAIYIDGVLQDQVTPHTFTLETNQYEVTVARDGYFTDPTSTTVNLGPAERVTRHFTLSQTAPTILSVRSSPAGAEVYLDNESEPRGVTPLDITLDDASPVDLSLVLDGYYVTPASITLDSITPSDTTRVFAGRDPLEGSFVLRSKKTVMFEGFSNVNCQGCPTLANYLDDRMHQEGYGLDRMLYCKFSMSWPNGSDPHFLQNQSENDDRMNFYLTAYGFGIPVLTCDGAFAGNGGDIPTSSELADLVDNPTLAEPGFLIDCEADFSGNTVPFTVTVTAMQDVDLSAQNLYVALVQSVIEYDEPPVEPNQGETVFHWLFRDRLDNPPAMSSLSAGQTQTFTGTLQRGEWDLDSLHVIAFAQNNTTRAISQAGISAVTETAPAALFIANSPDRPALREERP